MLRPGETFAHLRVNALRKLALDVLRHRRHTGNMSASAPSVAPSVLSSAGIGTLSANTSGARGITKGLDYTSWTSLDLKEFSSYQERMANLDRNLGVVLVQAYMADGHAHTGNGADGPLISSDCIRLDTSESLLALDTAMAHASDTRLHPSGTADANPFGACIYDQWQTLTGTPVYDGDSVTLTDSAIRLDMAWMDSFVLDCDILLSSASLDLFLLSDNITSGPYVRAMFSNESNTALYTKTNSSYNEQLLASSDSPVSASIVHVRAVFANNKLHLWIDDAVLSAPVSIPYGGICLSSTGTATVSNISISHIIPLDCADIDDFTDRLKTTLVTVTAHADTHKSGGSDALDVGILRDASDRMLDADEKNKLFSGGPSENIHTHTSEAVRVDADSTFYDHVTDISLHSGPLSTKAPRPVTGYEALTDGGEWSMARRDHAHMCPIWQIKRVLYSSTNAAIAQTDYTSETTFASAYTNYVPSAIGEYVEDGNSMRGVYSMFSNTRTWDEYYSVQLPSGEIEKHFVKTIYAYDWRYMSEHIRLAIGLENTTANIVYKRLFVPNISKDSAWAVVSNEQYPTKLDLAYALWRSKDCKDNFRTYSFSVPLLPGRNVLYIYIYRKQGYGLCPMILPVANDAFSIYTGTLLDFTLPPTLASLFDASVIPCNPWLSEGPLL